MTQHNTMKSSNVLAALLVICMGLGLMLCGCSSTSTNTESATIEGTTDSATAESDAANSIQAEEETIEEAEEVSDGTTEDGIISYSDEDIELLEAFGDDLNVIAEDEFLALVDEINSDPDAYIGQVYQVTGYYLTAIDDEGDSEYICQDDEDGNATGFTLRYVTQDLIEGQWYCITAIVAEEEHDEHSHLLFDVVAVESAEGH